MSNNKSTIVTIYSAPWCAYCHMAKEYLKGRGVACKDIDIEKDPQAAEYIIGKTGQAGIPIIEIGNETIIGFDRQRIDLALRDNKLV